ncbi:hypothetical protein GWA97_00640 [Flavobacterium sp. LaA7.5]|nr:hypothetical protein [Flavobacterium salilacus subsp. altitudinum]
MFTEKLKNHLYSFKGWRTNRKIVVIESDDWGSIRMPSKKAFNDLQQGGIPVGKSLYNSYDSLETANDLDTLFNVLINHKDSNNNHPVFTFNTVMSNPNFEKIEEAEFKNYYNESFFDSYVRYYGDDLRKVWSEAIGKELIVPQFHAREHLNIRLWMHDLKLKKAETLLAFKHGFFGLTTNTSSPNQKHYLAAYNVDSMEDFTSLKEITCDGLKIFEDTFGYKSTSFIGCNYVWPTELEEVLYNNGVKLLQGQRAQLCPNIDGSGTKIIRNYTGKKNNKGQIYTVRNADFEPYLSSADSVAGTMDAVKTAFLWKKPAIISTHRINYSGNIDIKKRDNNIKQLELLLSKIIKKYPDVEFLPSNKLLNIITDDYSHS